MMRLAIPVATVGIFSIVVTAVAGDRALRTVDPSRDVRETALVIRPPASIPPPRGRAAAPSKASSTDHHVAEFLRWKEQHANRAR